MVVPWLPDVGTVVVYLLRKRTSEGSGAGRDLVAAEGSERFEAERQSGVLERLPTRPVNEREMDALRRLVPRLEH